MNPGHAQIHIGGVCVDAGVAPLLQALWAQGYETQWSCEGYVRPLGVPYTNIVFAYLADAVRFFESTIKLLTAAAPELFYERSPFLFRVEPMCVMVDWPHVRGAVDFDAAMLPVITALHVKGDA